LVITKLSKNIRHFPFFCDTTANARPAVAISACLNGRTVRYDAKDKSLSTRHCLSMHVKLLEHCPEVSVGMPTPRPAVQLVQVADDVRALERDDPSIDVTDLLKTQRVKNLAEFQQEKICGYIFKSKSPSCGLGSTPIFNPQGQQVAMGNGLHADYFLEKMPWIILRDEHHLNTKELCENFVFLCFLVFDLQTSIEKKMLASFNQHYQFLFQKMNSQARENLADALACASNTNYKMTFKTEIEKLILETNISETNNTKN
jgi:uncharacterized protein YbbK (DUF523 family)